MSLTNNYSWGLWVSDLSERCKDFLDLVSQNLTHKKNSTCTHTEVSAHKLQDWLTALDNSQFNRKDELEKGGIWGVFRGLSRGEQGRRGEGWESRGQQTEPSTSPPKKWSYLPCQWAPGLPQSRPTCRRRRSVGPQTAACQPEDRLPAAHLQSCSRMLWLRKTQS